MAKCDEGYLCDVCGQDVAILAESDLYLRYIVGILDPEVLHTTPERHIRCNPELAQYIVADDFPPMFREGPFDKRNLDAPAAGGGSTRWLSKKFRSSSIRCPRCWPKSRAVRRGLRERR
jgi:hypothetical protein